MSVNVPASLVAAQPRSAALLQLKLSEGRGSLPAPRSTTEGAAANAFAVQHGIK
ncbi:hypothetical protein AVDCRST_MAG94-7075 [uncultured Leptolyngbya sp.]|uniref:Uncharacterized protein n=1 Tax=uncultured Leptolyngbya sp. TaxID=332963 RepID=A0A6J4PU06_9CYAN|nr:hypothetical protein AVDCRST_MAG94-7075 [uncultured Leptolyngbya sp.]